MVHDVDLNLTTILDKPTREKPQFVNIFNFPRASPHFSGKTTTTTIRKSTVQSKTMI